MGRLIIFELFHNSSLSVFPFISLLELVLSLSSLCYCADQLEWKLWLISWTHGNIKIGKELQDHQVFDQKVQPLSDLIYS